MSLRDLLTRYLALESSDGPPERQELRRQMRAILDAPKTREELAAEIERQCPGLQPIMYTAFAELVERFG